MSVDTITSGSIGFRTFRLLNAHGRKLLFAVLVTLLVTTGTAVGEDIFVEPQGTESSDEGP